MRRTVVFLAIVSVFWGIGAAGQSKRGSPEQLEFSAEDEGVKRPVRIPSDVWAILKKNKIVSDGLESEGLSPDQLPASWFSASVVHLGGADEKDYVVAAEGKMVGANISPFWVFIRTRQGVKLVLQLSAHDLLIERGRSHGYRNIQSSGATAVTITTLYFRFDGKKYRLHREVTEDIK